MNNQTNPTPTHPHQFSKLRDLGQAIESKKQLNALCEDKKTIFSLSSNFLRDLNDVSADWLRFCFIFPFCFLPLKPLFLEVCEMNLVSILAHKLNIPPPPPPPKKKDRKLL